MADTWNPVALEVLRDEYHLPSTRRFPDLSIVGGFAPVVSERAASVIASVIADSAELLPVTCEGRRLFALNVINLTPALDLERSSVRRFKDGGRVMRVERHVFNPQLLDGSIFKILEIPRSWVYVTDPLVEAAKSASLLGFKFRLVWDSVSEES